MHVLLDEAPSLDVAVVLPYGITTAARSRQQNVVMTAQIWQEMCLCVSFSELSVQTGHLHTHRNASWSGSASAGPSVPSISSFI